MKKHLLIPIIFIWLFTFFGCTKDDTSVSTPINNDSSSIEVSEEGDEDIVYSDRSLSYMGEATYKKVSGYSYNQINSKYGYNSLEMQKEVDLYNLMKDNISKITNEKDEEGCYIIKPIELSGVVADSSMIQKVFKAFQYDNPEIFWVANRISFTKKSDSTVIKFKSVISIDECNNIMKELNEKLSAIFSQIPPNLSEYDRELYIHDLIVSSCTYDENVNNKKSWRSYTLVGVLLDNKAVCEGYSKTIQYLLCNIGVECRVITGKKGNEHHMWNIVKINDNWYHLDATWDSTSEMGKYNYFNLNDETIKYDHSIDKEYNKNIIDLGNYRYNFKLPKCNSMTENYFYKNALKLDSFDEKSDNYMVQKISSMLNRKDKYIRILISPHMDYDSTISALFSNKPYKFFYYLNKIEDNNMSTNKVDREKIYFTESKALNAAIIEINYM